MRQHTGFRGKRVGAGATSLLLATLAFVPAASAQDATTLPPMVVHADGQKVKISGILVDRHGDQLRVREGNVATHTVLLTNDTKISTPSGLFKMDRKRRDESNLLPGLMLQVEGKGGSDGAVVAEEIHFSTRSMKVAQQINVGGEVVRNQVNANTDSIEVIKRRLTDSLSHVNARVTNLDNFDERYSTVVNFATDSWTLTDAAKGVLSDMAGRVARFKGYYIEVKGFADTTGTVEYNLQLSQKRAEAVVRYLTEIKDVPLRRILNPTGFGESSAIAANSNAVGKAMNRRATVRVLVAKGQQK
jgi:outer membrane protein OmpA-like peptidoglycan-associated protein